MVIRSECKQLQIHVYIPYSGYFLGGKIFLVFMVERQTTKFLPTKQYHNLLGCDLVYCDHENISTNWPKIWKFYSPKNTHYTVAISLVHLEGGGGGG